MGRKSDSVIATLYEIQQGYKSKEIKKSATYWGRKVLLNRKGVSPNVGFIIDLKAAIMNMFKEPMEIMFKELIKTMTTMIQCMKRNKDKVYERTT